MLNRGSGKPKATERYLHLINADGSGKDAFIHPSALRSIEVRSTSEPRLRIKTDSVTATVRGAEAQELLDWLARIAGLVITAEI